MNDPLERLLRAVEATDPSELDCAGALEELGAYFEALSEDQRSVDFARLRQHLEVCACCTQELELLRAALGD